MPPQLLRTREIEMMFPTLLLTTGIVIAGTETESATAGIAGTMPSRTNGVLAAPVEPDGRMSLPFSAVPQPTPLNDGAAANDVIVDDDVLGGKFVVFREPAAFEVVSAFPCGMQTTNVTAVIYEGMAIRFEENGKYTVRFVLETPATNVTLRLQYQLFDRCQRQDGSGPTVEEWKRVGTISLPPIRFEGVSQTPGDGRSRSWHVEHVGYSPLLDRQKHVRPQLSDLHLVRIGAAEIGSIPTR